MPPLRGPVEPPARDHVPGVLLRHHVRVERLVLGRPELDRRERAFLLRRGAPAARELVLVFSVGLALEHPYFAVRRVPDLLELVDGPLEVGHAEDAHQKPVGYLGDLYAESGQTLQGSFSAVSTPKFAN